MRLPVLGIGVVSAAGCGVEALKAVLEGARSPRVESVSVAGEGGPFDLPVYVAAADGLERFMPRRALRRLDKFTRMALLAAFLAVEDSGLNINDRSRLGLVFGIRTRSLTMGITGRLRPCSRTRCTMPRLQQSRFS